MAEETPQAEVNFGNRGKGRKKGSKNKTNVVLKDAILLAATKVGFDGKGKEGLPGYLKSVAMKDPKAFCGLLAKIMPTQITGEGGGPIMTATREMTDEELLDIASGRSA